MPQGDADGERIDSKDGVRAYLAKHGLGQAPPVAKLPPRRRSVSPSPERSDQHQTLEVGAVTIRATRHIPLRIALRDIIAIVCRVDLKRAGGRVKQLKAKLQGVVLGHDFGTAQPPR